MKAFKTLLAAGFCLALAVGCNSTSNKESMLSAAGFRTVPADTPERQAHLQSLPPDKITPIQRDGTVYYTFPDPKRNVLFVGQEPQYQEYQRLSIDQQMANEQMMTAQVNQSDTGWAVWGPFGWGWR